MATASNPLVGSAWGGNAPINPGLFQLPSQPGIPAAPQGPYGNPGNLPNPVTNQKDTSRNAGLLNVETGQMRNDLIPQFASTLFGYAQPAAQTFANFANLGSPYYQQQQQSSFNQGVQQNNNAAAQAKQQLQSQGYGHTPSGAMAGMIGGMQQSGAQSLAQQFLQNLFQNENLQMQGAQSLAQLAAQFNPNALLGQSTPFLSTQGPAYGQTALQSLLSSGASAYGSYANNN